MKKLALTAALLAAAPALVLAQSSQRAGRNEIYLAPVFTEGKAYSFEGGSSAHTDTGYGLLFGWARNFSPHVAGGLEIAWSHQDYRATVQPGPGNSFAATSVGGLGGSSGKEMGFAAVVCIAWATSRFAVPIRAAANESLSVSRRFMVLLT